MLVLLLSWPNGMTKMWKRLLSPLPQGWTPQRGQYIVMPSFIQLRQWQIYDTSSWFLGATRSRRGKKELSHWTIRGGLTELACKRNNWHRKKFPFHCGTMSVLFVHVYLEKIEKIFSVCPPAPNSILNFDVLCSPLACSECGMWQQDWVWHPPRLSRHMPVLQWCKSLTNLSFKAAWEPIQYTLASKCCWINTLTEVSCYPCNPLFSVFTLF